MGHLSEQNMVKHMTFYIFYTRFFWTFFRWKISMSNPKSRTVSAAWHGPRSSSVNESACHPFKAGRFLFAHNGLVGNFTQIRRELLTSLNEQLGEDGEGMKGRMWFFQCG